MHGACPSMSQASLRAGFCLLKLLTSLKLLKLMSLLVVSMQEWNMQEHAGTCRNCVWRLSDWTTWFSWLSIAVRKFPSWFFESSWSQIYQADKGRENGCLVQKTEWEVVCSYHSSEKMQGWHRVVWRKRASGCVQDWDRFGQARAEYACGVLPPENAQQFMYQYLIMQNNDEYCACINVCPYRYL